MKQTCAIYLVFGRKLKIPVNPEKIEISHPTDHKTYNVLGIGEIVVPRKPSLKTVSWESFFPGNQGEPYADDGARAPEAYVEVLTTAMEEKTIGRLIISRSELYDTNMACVIQSFTTTDKGGEPADIYYSIELQEYRSYAPQTISILESQPTVGNEAAAAAEPERSVETPVLRVGASVIANGKYWYDSYGAKPFGTANNLSTTVTRIVEGNPYPIHIGHYGWLAANQLQITG